MAIVVGLTGNLASGKSTVATILKELGAHIIDADAIAHQIMKKDSPTWKAIVDEFGGAILNPDGSINRKSLASIVFNSPERLKRLNAITHPPIRAEIERRTELIKRSSPHAIIVVEAALLIEAGSHQKVDVVVLVTSTEKEQIRRAIKKFSITEKEARQRLRAQMAQEEKRKYAHFIIDNSGSLEATRRAVEALYHRLEKMEQEMKTGQKGVDRVPE